METETCCPYCNYVCDDETHKAAANIEGVEYEIISREPAWIQTAGEWGENVELSPIVVKGLKPSGGVNNAFTDSNMPIVIDNVPYTDIVGADYLNAVSAENTAASPNADTVTASVQENVAAENTAPATDAQANTAPQAEKGVEIPAAVNETAGTAGNIVSSAKAPVNKMHKEMLEQLDRLKIESSFAHDTAAGISHNIIKLENDEIYAERRAFYAENKEALNELAEKLRTESAEVRKAEGELASKFYFVKGVARTLGLAGTALDLWELGSRAKTAYETDDWSPVAGSLTKLALTPVAIAGGVAVGAGIGALIAGLAIPAGIVTGVVVVSSAAATYFLLEPLDSLDESITKSGSFNFADNSENQQVDLVLVGNHNHQEDVKLEADNVTLIGHQNFTNLEVKAENFTVIGDISASGTLNVETEQYNGVDPASISQEFADNLNKDGPKQRDENSPVQQESPPNPDDNSLIFTDEPYINLEYAQSGADLSNITVTEYIDSLLQPPNIDDLPFPELYDQIVQYQTEELEKIFGDNAFDDAVDFLRQQKNHTYPVSPAIQSLPDTMEESHL